MSSTVSRPDDAETDPVTVTVDDATRIAAALDDADCRAILSVTADKYCTAREISDRCDVPLSTTYRKLDQLVEAGLLTDRTCLHDLGNHATEYTQRIRDLTVTISAEAGVEVTVTYDPTDSHVVGVR